MNTHIYICIETCKYIIAAGPDAEEAQAFAPAHREGSEEEGGRQRQAFRHADMHACRHACRHASRRSYKHAYTHAYLNLHMNAHARARARARLLMLVRVCLHICACTLKNARAYNSRHRFIQTLHVCIHWQVESHVIVATKCYYMAIHSSVRPLFRIQLASATLRRCHLLVMVEVFITIKRIA